MTPITASKKEMQCRKPVPRSVPRTRTRLRSRARTTRPTSPKTDLPMSVTVFFAFVAFVSGAVVAGVQRAYALGLIAAGLALWLLSTGVVHFH